MSQKNYDGLFKGFIRTKNKAATEKFKSRNEFREYDDIKDFPEFAGVIKDNIILIDIDDLEQSDILLDILKNEGIRATVFKTNRGKHFYFKNSKINKCGTHLNLACGLSADIKIGERNSYGVVKFDNKERECLMRYENLDEVPDFLMPINAKTNFLGMAEGDGRNQKFYNYILILQSNNFSTEEIRSTIKLINKYVITEPLSDDELEVILRDEAFKKPVFFVKEKFQFDKFAEYMKKTSHIVKINGQLHIYENGIYTGNLEQIETEMIKLIPSLRRTQRREVIDYLSLICENNKLDKNPTLIAFENGVLDIVSGKILDYSPDMYITNKIPWNYVPEAYSELCDKTLNKMACNDEQIRAVLEECIGSCMYRGNQLAGGKAFILTGADGSNGKSTFLDVLQCVIGEENTCSLDLSELSDRFSTVMLYNKLCDIGDDIADDYIANTAIFKKIVTGNMISAEYKGMNKFNFIPYCKLLFSANNIPRLGKGKDSQALKRRLVIIPFNAKFSSRDKDYDPFIKFKLMQRESVEYLIKIGIEGLLRVLGTNTYTVSDKVEKELDEFELENNPLLMFFKDLDSKEIENETTTDVYRKYCIFCSSSNLTPISKISFSKQVCSRYMFKVVSIRRGKDVLRVFVSQ